MHIEEILQQSIILSPHIKLSFSSNNPYFTVSHPKTITDKFTKIRDFCRFLQPGLTSYTRFEEKLVHNSQWLEAQN